MSYFRQLRKYLNYRKWIRRVPRQYIIDTSDLKDATRDQTLLVMAGLARNAREAQRLMDKKGLGAVELLDRLPPRKRINRRERLIRLIMRWQRATASDPLRRVKPQAETLRLQTKWKDGL